MQSSKKPEKNSTDFQDDVIKHHHTGDPQSFLLGLSDEQVIY
jgi:hypothetical protein